MLLHKNWVERKRIPLFTSQFVFISAPSSSILCANDLTFSMTIQGKNTVHCKLTPWSRFYSCSTFSMTLLQPVWIWDLFLFINFSFVKPNQLLPYVNTFPLSWLPSKTHFEKFQNHQQNSFEQHII